MNATTTKTHTATGRNQVTKLDNGRWGFTGQVDADLADRTFSTMGAAEAVQMAPPGWLKDHDTN